MSFINCPSLPAFGKCVISFWYRVPQSTLVALGAAQPIGAEPNDYPEFDDIAPLVVLGQPLTQRVFDFQSGRGINVVASGPNYDANNHVIAGQWEIASWASRLVESHYLDPSYIGVNHRGELVVNLQFDQMPVVKDYAQDPTGVQEEDILPDPPAPDSLTLRFFAPTGYRDVSVETLMRGVPDSYQFTVSIPSLPKANQWHHVVLSFDMGSKIKVVGATDPSTRFADGVISCAKVWMAVDDVPINLKDLTLTLDGQPDDGSILSDAQWQIATTPYYAFPDINLTFTRTGYDRPIDPVSGFPFGNTNLDVFTFTAPRDDPSYTMDNPRIPASPIGLPGTARAKKSVRHIEMAEFQMWTNISLDVRDDSVRRNFITQDGKPNLELEAVDKALGTPQIRLHKSGNWIKGKNTGSGKQFAPKGKIIRYKPDPSLTGKQGKPQ